MRRQAQRAGRAGRRTERAAPRRRVRHRRVRVRVETDAANYVGSLQLGTHWGGLNDVLNDGRAYLALWEATRDGSSPVEEFLALHKATIRSVVILEPSRQMPRPFRRTER